jgi:hypothetical protein
MNSLTPREPALLEPAQEGLPAGLVLLAALHDAQHVPVVVRIDADGSAGSRRCAPRRPAALQRAHPGTRRAFLFSGRAKAIVRYLGAGIGAGAPP